MVIIDEITMVEFEAGLKATQTVLIPVGSTEEHGTHLPLATDTLQAVEVGKKVAQIRPVFIAPPIPYGVCRSTSQHPGTISISTETLQCLVTDLVHSFYGQGMRNFIFLSGHAGGTHVSALMDAGEKMLAQYEDIRVAVLTEYLLAWEQGKDLVETRGDAHAGEIETSRILHSHPHLVKGTSPKEFPSFPPGILVRDKRKFWPGGVWGDPGCASAEKGRLIEDKVLQALDRFIESFESFEE